MGVARGWARRQMKARAASLPDLADLETRVPAHAGFSSASMFSGSEIRGTGTALAARGGWKMLQDRSVTECRESGERLADFICAGQVRVDRCHDDTGVYCEQVDADNRDAYPGVDNNPLIEDVVEHIDDAGAGRATLKFGHANGTDDARRKVVAPPYTSALELRPYEYRGSGLCGG